MLVFGLVALEEYLFHLVISILLTQSNKRLRSAKLFSTRMFLGLCGGSAMEITLSAFVGGITTLLHKPL
jgi:hypothetical protein